MALRIIPRLQRATHHVGVFLDRARDRFPVTQAEAHVLSFLCERAGEASIADLHRSFGHKRSTLTSIVNRLEERGLVQRAIHPDDRRSFVLTLTRDGARLAGGLLGSLERLEKRAMKKLDRAQLEAFETVLAAIEAATGEDVSK
jgi:DNA-binding MarR family transcriptional regulator